MSEFPEYKLVPQSHVVRVKKINPLHPSYLNLIGFERVLNLSRCDECLFLSYVASPGASWMVRVIISPKKDGDTVNANETYIGTICQDSEKPVQYFMQWSQDF